MGTLDDEKQEESTDRMIRRRKTPIPIEIIEEDILSRLPVKSLLRFRCVSKLWRSLIFDPRFIELHYTHTISKRLVGEGSALFIYAYDSKHNGHLLSAAHEGGEVTQLLTLPKFYHPMECTAEHLNGLVLLASRKKWNRFGAIFNPSTRRICKLPDRVCNMRDYSYSGYLFGFDETTNEHKVLHIRLLATKDFKSNFIDCKIIDFSIFTLSTNSWRKIDVELPIGIDIMDFERWNFKSVCLNSVIHLFFHWKEIILTFDLRKETFSIKKLPLGALPYVHFRHNNGMRIYSTFLMKISGLLGLVCHFNVVESNEVHILILKDYENEVWVKEI